MRRFASVLFLILLSDVMPGGATLIFGAGRAAADSIDLTQATVVIRGGALPAAEKIAPVILTEEMAKRTGVRWSVTDRWPQGKRAVIALSTKSAPPNWKEHIPATPDVAGGKPEGFSIRVLRAEGAQPDRVFITGSDPRGVMFGVGKLLRVLEWGAGPITLPADFSADLAPDRAIRGHQIGYRATANSWDAWTVEQYDQYFRDMVVFGANAVENIPFEGKTSRRDEVRPTGDESQIRRAVRQVRPRSLGLGAGRLPASQPAEGGRIPQTAGGILQVVPAARRRVCSGGRSGRQRREGSLALRRANGRLAAQVSSAGQGLDLAAAASSGRRRRLFRLSRNQAAELVRRRGDGAQRPADGIVPPPAPASRTSSAGIRTSRTSFAASTQSRGSMRPGA